MERQDILDPPREEAAGFLSKRGGLGDQLVTKG